MSIIYPNIDCRCHKGKVFNRTDLCPARQARKAKVWRSNKRGAGWRSLGDGSHQRQTFGV